MSAGRFVHRVHVEPGRQINRMPVIPLKRLQLLCVRFNSFDARVRDQDVV
jgi:hypothetical protein